MRKQLILGINVIIILLSLLTITAMKVQAAVPRDGIPPELDLEVVSAPNYQSSPCPLTGQNQGDQKFDHAAHHRSGGTGIAPVPLNENEAIKQLTESRTVVSNLLQIVDSGIK